MAVADHAVVSVALRIAEDADVSNWVESLAARECTQDEFLDAILRLRKQDADAGWEALALLDQEFRRRGISPEVYLDLKAALHQQFTPRDEIPRQGQLGSAPMAPRRARAAKVSLHGGLHVGDKLHEQYRVVRILHRTALGTLVEAVDEVKIELTGMHRRVAIQVVDESLSQEQALLHRMSRLLCLSHPSIAQMLEVDRDNGALLLIMELLDGPSLNDLVAPTASKALHVSILQAALRAAANALTYAHSRGVTHGDVTARNILAAPDGGFRLQGFERQDPTHAADVASDRRAFARLAYKVLAGPQKPGAQQGHLQFLAPRGVTRQQWRALRAALNGKDDHTQVLAAFAGEAPGT